MRTLAKVIEETVTKLLDKATACQSGDNAVRFAQAALNAAHVWHALAQHPAQQKDA